MSGRSPAFLVAVTSLTCVGVGYVVGSSRVPVVPVASTPATTRTDDDAVTDALRDVTARLDAIERALANRPAPPQRQDVTPTPAPDARSPAHDDLARLVDRLQEVVTRLPGSLAEAANDALRQSRVRNPAPNLAAARMVRDRVLQQEDQVYEEQTARRELLLRTMAETMDQLGMPNNVFVDSKQANDVWWEYSQGDERLLTVRFRNGLVVDVDD